MTILMLKKNYCLKNVLHEYCQLRCSQNCNDYPLGIGDEKAELADAAATDDGGNININTSINQSD